MIDLFEVALELQDFCKNQKWKFCIIGGVALQRWGEPRVTQDVDLSLLTGFGGEEIFIDSLLAHYQARIQDAREFAIQNRVLLLKSSSGIGIDIAFAALPFEEEVISRSSYYDFLPNVSLLTCSAEDLIVLKAFASRGRDWTDVENVAIRNKAKLDWSYIFNQLEPLVELKEEPEILSKLEKIKRDYSD